MRTPSSVEDGVRFAFAFCIRCIIGHTFVCVGIQNQENRKLKSVDMHKKNGKTLAVQGFLFWYGQQDLNLF